MPLCLCHYVAPLTYALCYETFTVVYFIAGGTGEESRLIYSILDYESDIPMSIVALLVLNFVLGPLFYLVSYGITKVRDGCLGTEEAVVDESTALKDQQHLP